MKKYLFILAAAFTMLAACEKDQNGDGNGSLKENPNPTSISSLYLAKTEIAVDPDGFNMLTDGGFENFIGDENWKSKSLYYMPEYVSEAEIPLTGSRSLHANHSTPFAESIATVRPSNSCRNLRTTPTLPPSQPTTSSHSTTLPSSTASTTTVHHEPLPALRIRLRNKSLKFFNFFAT